MPNNYIPHLSKDSNELYHYRTPGSKNGVRKYQNPDGSLTALGRQHYGVGDPRVASAENAYATNARLRRWNNVVSEKDRPSHGTYNAIKREANEAMQRSYNEGAAYRNQAQAQANANRIKYAREAARMQAFNQGMADRERQQAEANARQAKSGRNAVLRSQYANSISDRERQQAEANAARVKAGKEATNNTLRNQYANSISSRERQQAEANARQAKSGRNAVLRSQYANSISDRERQQAEANARQAKSGRVATEAYNKTLPGMYNKAKYEVQKNAGYLVRDVKGTANRVGKAAQIIGENAMESIRGVGKNINQYLDGGAQQEKARQWAEAAERYKRIMNSPSYSPADQQQAKKAYENAVKQAESYQKQYENSLKAQTDNVKRGIDSAVKVAGEKFDSAKNYVSESAGRVSKTVSEFASKTYDDVVKAADEGIGHAKEWLRKLFHK